MMSVGRMVGRLGLGINAGVVGLLWLCAYSPYVDPVASPVLSCVGLAFPVFAVLNLCFAVFWLVVRRRYVVLPLLGFAIAWGAVRSYASFTLFSSDIPEGAIKVLSYNTEAFSGRKSHTQEKANPVLAYLAESNADIICLQEYIVGGRLKKKDVDYALRKYRYRHFQRVGAGNGLGLYSRFPILKVYPLCYESMYNGSVAYELKVGSDTLLVVNNHLESNKLTEGDKEAYLDIVHDPSNQQKVKRGARRLGKKLAEASSIRSVQADSVAGFLRRHARKYMLVCGDFNDSPISYAHRVIGEGLKDAFVEAGNGLGISYNRNYFYFRIDHLLVSSALEPIRCVVDHTISASDHYPVWCYLKMKEDRAE